MKWPFPFLSLALCITDYSREDISFYSHFTHISVFSAVLRWSSEPSGDLCTLLPGKGALEEVRHVLYLPDTGCFPGRRDHIWHVFWYVIVNCKMGYASLVSVPSPMSAEHLHASYSNTPNLYLTQGPITQSGVADGHGHHSVKP